jgi:hypothetical protein
VRELENTIERLVVFSRGRIEVQDLPESILAAPPLEERLFADLPTLDELERRYLVHVLGAVGGNARGQRKRWASIAERSIAWRSDLESISTRRADRSPPPPRDGGLGKLRAAVTPLPARCRYLRAVSFPHGELAHPLLNLDARATGPVRGAWDGQAAKTASGASA